MEVPTNITIAIADDHTDVRKMLVYQLTGQGYEVIIEAENGSMLVDRLLSAVRLPNICIIDISMPIMKGYDLAKIIREKLPAIKILAISFGQIPGDLLKMIESGAVGFINKTDAPEQWEMAIKSISSGNYYFNHWAIATIISILHKSNASFLR